MQPTPSTPLILPRTSRRSRPLYNQDGINFDASINGGEEITLFRNGTLQMAFCWNIAQQTNADNSAAGTTNSGDDILFMAFPTESGDPHCAAASGASACLTTATRTRSLPQDLHQLHGQL